MSHTDENEVEKAQSARSTAPSATDQSFQKRSSFGGRELETHTTRHQVTRRAIYVLVLIIVSIGVVYASLFFQHLNIAPRGLGKGLQQRMSTLASSWSKGNAIVLIRHSERCDHSDAPCLDNPEGITARGKDQALAMARVFEKLGIQRTDILTSPATRTKQTASFIFNVAAIESEALSSCKTITLDDVVNKKSSGRNLVMVTHSHCIEQLERLMNVEPFKETDYGSLLFISFDESTRQAITAELIDATEFMTGFIPKK